MAEQTSTSTPTGKADELIAEVGSYSNDQLASLLAEEQAADKPRSTVIEAIEAEQKRRADEKAEAAKKETKFSIEELLDNARHFTGYSRHILAGALHGKSGKLTAAQAKKAAKEFAGRKVKAADEKEGES